MARAGPKLGSSCLPVQALDLVCQHHPTHVAMRGQGNFKRVPLDLTGYGTAQRQAGHTVVGCGTEHQGRSTACLLMPRLGRKANPHYVAAVWNIAGSRTLGYHTSAPWAGPVSWSLCRFSGVICATMASKSYVRLRKTTKSPSGDYFDSGTLLHSPLLRNGLGYAHCQASTPLGNICYSCHHTTSRELYIIDIITTTSRRSPS